MKVPSSTLLNALAEAYVYPANGLDTVTEALSALDADARLGFAEQIDRALEARSEFEDLTAQQLAYTRLFIGSFKMEAPPYASYYLDGQLIGGETTAAVREVFFQFGIKVSEKQEAPADHLRYLLAFLMLMAQRYEETGMAEYAEAFVDFRDEFVFSWIAQFKELVDTCAEHEFYKLLADLTIAVLEDCEVEEATA